MRNNGAVHYTSYNTCDNPTQQSSFRSQCNRSAGQEMFYIKPGTLFTRGRRWSVSGVSSIQPTSSDTISVRPILIFFSHIYSRATGQAIYRRPLTAEARIRPQASPRGTCGGQSGYGTGVSTSTSVVPFHQCSILLHSSITDDIL